MVPSDRIKRFFSYVEFTQGCWMWRGGRFKGGYGQFRNGDKKVKAHRFAYELSYGNIRLGAIICHSCDTPQCVNPAHLWEGTHRENALDREKKGRSDNEKASLIKRERGSCAGERNGGCKLDPRTVLSVRAFRKDGHSYSSLSSIFKISKSQAANISKGRSWKCLTKQP